MCHENFIIGYTSGVFDMFHIGHLNILKRAKELCDFLIVGVSTDELVREYKHKSPIISYDNRKAIVEACKYVDKVVPQVNRDKMSAYHRLHVFIYKFGSDFFVRCENKYIRPFQYLRLLASFVVNSLTKCCIFYFKNFETL